MNQLLSNSVDDLAKGIEQAIKQHSKSDKILLAEQGVDYYNYKHDILDNRIFYIDENGLLKEDKHASNIKIANPFLTELIDQKVQYLLSNPVEIETEDEKLKREIESYFDEDFQVFLSQLVTNASQKGFEYAYPRTTASGKIVFEVVDGMKVIPVYDNKNNLVRVLRYYVNDIVKDNKTVELMTAELYDNSKVWTFIKEGKKTFTLDTSLSVNPAPHIQASNGTDIVGRDYGTIPLYRFSNNNAEKTDLEPIKALIDDVDLMSSFMSNNLQSFSEAFYIVKGFAGSVGDLQKNIRAKKVVGVGEGGDVDIKTVNVPTEGRKTKIELDKENIYKFGFGFDSSQIGDGNITNVVIKSRYSLLDMKANKTEKFLRAFLKWALEIVVKDINLKSGTAYSANDVKFIIKRNVIVNESDVVNNDKLKADTKAVLINAIIASAPIIGNDDTLKLIAEQFELDLDELKANIEQSEYQDVTLE